MNLEILACHGERGHIFPKEQSASCCRNECTWRLERDFFHCLWSWVGMLHPTSSATISMCGERSLVSVDWHPKETEPELNILLPPSLQLILYHSLGHLMTTPGGRKKGAHIADVKVKGYMSLHLSHVARHPRVCYLPCLFFLRQTDCLWDKPWWK